MSEFGDYHELIAKEGNLKKSDIESLIKKGRMDIYGDEFYFAVVGVEGDINIASENIFGDLPLPKYIKPIGNDPSKTPLENYLNQFIVDQKDIAAKIGTDPSSLSRFVKGVRRIFAYQVYFIAKSHGKLASEVFEFLYGNKEQN